MDDPADKYDLFISHASEDKSGLVRDLANALRNLGLKVWYDEFSLRQGDSLSESIDRGLASSQFGLVVLSRAFLAKRWPRRELQGLVAREIADGTVILPVWHGVTRADVVAFSPPLADKLAFDTASSDGTTLALQILQRVRPELYLAHSREDLAHMAGESVVAVLQDEIEAARHEAERLRDELSEFQCPTCKAKLLYSQIVPVEHGDYRADRYECGYETEDGHQSSPCPYSSDYPSPEDFDVTTTERAGGGFISWAHGKTYMASLVRVTPGQGETAEEAAADIRQRLPRRRQLPRRQ
jgi:hypothetical protein